MIETIRVLVIGDDPSLAESLGQRLPRLGNVLVTGTVDADEAAAAFESGEVDLAVVDVDRSGHAGIRAIEDLRAAFDGSRALGISEFQSPEVLIGALGAGACGVVSQRLPGEQLRRAISRAAAGELVVPESELHNVVGRLHESAPAMTDKARVASLSARETEILLALADGLSTSELATRLGISIMTVQSHVKSILAKLGVHSKVEAVTLAWRTGLTAVSRSA